MPTKQTPNDHENEAQEEVAQSALEQFFFHQKRALEETGKALEALLPDGFKEHGSKAGQEFAKGFKILIDSAIDDLKAASERDEESDSEASDSGKEPPSSSTGRTKVRIELD